MTREEAGGTVELFREAWQVSKSLNLIFGAMWSYPKGFFVWFWVVCLLPKIFSREMIEISGRFFWLGCEETGSEPGKTGGR